MCRLPGLVSVPRTPAVLCNVGVLPKLMKAYPNNGSRLLSGDVRELLWHCFLASKAHTTTALLPVFLNDANNR